MSFNLTNFQYLNKLSMMILPQFRHRHRLSMDRAQMRRSARQTFKTMLILAAAGLVCSSCASTSKFNAGEKGASLREISSSRLPAEIDKVLDDTLLLPAFIGIKIVTADNGAIMYQRNSHKLFHPASNMKLLTTATALRKLGPDYVFKTVVTADTPAENGVLRGNLYISGIGDPLMKTSHLDSLAAELSASGVSRITGDIIGNASCFDDLFWGSGWMWDDEPSTDAAFITPLTVNSNSVVISVTPGRQPGDTVGFSVEPPTEVITIVNEGITSTDTALPEMSVDRVKRDNIVHVKGRMSPGSARQEFPISVWRPELYFLDLLKHCFSAHNVSIAGSMRLDTLHGAHLLGTISHPLDSVLQQINKPSDNLGAENLLKLLAKELRGQRGSTAVGLSIVKSYLFDAGVDTTKIILADGSGLSWYNAISPDAVIHLLSEQYRHKETFNHFYESLPIAGVDGTLKNRMKGTRAEGNVHAKTGSLTGVSSLSGYVKTADGTTLLFSIMCNHFPGDISALRNAQNHILELLADTNFNMP